MILERTGYPLDVTTGQRKYGGPPPNWEGSTPGNGCEVNFKKITKTSIIRFCRFVFHYFMNVNE